jgi:hypothetical protein
MCIIHKYHPLSLTILPSSHSTLSAVHASSSSVHSFLVHTTIAASTSTWQSYSFVSEVKQSEVEGCTDCVGKGLSSAGGAGLGA